MIIAFALLGSYFFYFFVLVAASVALAEFYVLSQRKGGSPLKILGLLMGVCVVSTFFYTRILESIGPLFQNVLTNVRLPSQWQLLLLLLLVFVPLILLVEIVRGKGSPIFNFGSTLGGVLYVSLPLGTLVGIRELFGEKFLPGRFLSFVGADSGELAHDLVYRWGGYLAITIFASIWICDTVAQFVGLKFGKHKLSPRVSPNKTWEGAVGGFVAAILAALLARFLLLPFLSIAETLIIGTVVGIFGQMGDLAESLLKRDAQVKDSSSLIPGHGGVLDRFDSLIFVSPILFLYFDLVVF